MSRIIFSLHLLPFLASKASFNTTQFSFSKNMEAKKAAQVCVTGGSGFIASWLIKLLLEQGYSVRATVRDPENIEKAKHLWGFAHARGNLELVRADLLDEGSFDAAVDGCEGVFHTASPVMLSSNNPEEDLIKPALEGTLNVLKACAKSKCLQRIVLTSSIAAVIHTSKVKAGTVVDETFWSDKKYCKEKGLWYPLSKLLAEESAWIFAKDKELDLVVINPGLVVGRPLHSDLDVGSKAVIEALTGVPSFLEHTAYAWVDVQDVAKAHLLAFEVPTASGRYICAGEQSLDYTTVVEALRKIKPGHLFPTRLVDKQSPDVISYSVCTNKLKSIGLTCRAVDPAWKESLECSIERGLL